MNDFSVLNEFGAAAVEAEANNCRFGLFAPPLKKWLVFAFGFVLNDITIFLS